MIKTLNGASRNIQIAGSERVIRNRFEGTVSCGNEYEKKLSPINQIEPLIKTSELKIKRCVR